MEGSKPHDFHLVPILLLGLPSLLNSWLHLENSLPCEEAASFRTTPKCSPGAPTAANVVPSPGTRRSEFTTLASMRCRTMAAATIQDSVLDRILMQFFLLVGEPPLHLIYTHSINSLTLIAVTNDLDVLRFHEFSLVFLFCIFLYPLAW